MYQDTRSSMWLNKCKAQFQHLTTSAECRSRNNNDPCTNRQEWCPPPWDKGAPPGTQAEIRDRCTKIGLSEDDGPNPCTTKDYRDHRLCALQPEASTTRRGQDYDPNLDPRTRVSSPNGFDPSGDTEVAACPRCRVLHCDHCRCMQCKFYRVTSYASSVERFRRRINFNEKLALPKLSLYPYCHGNEKGKRRGSKKNPKCYQRWNFSSKVRCSKYSLSLQEQEAKLAALEASLKNPNSNAPRKPRVQTFAHPPPCLGLILKPHMSSWYKYDESQGLSRTKAEVKCQEYLDKKRDRLNKAEEDERNKKPLVHPFLHAKEHDHPHLDPVLVIKKASPPLPKAKSPPTSPILIPSTLKLLVDEEFRRNFDDGGLWDVNLGFQKGRSPAVKGDPAISDSASNFPTHRNRDSDEGEEDWEGSEDLDGDGYDDEDDPEGRDDESDPEGSDDELYYNLKNGFRGVSTGKDIEGSPILSYPNDKYGPDRFGHVDRFRDKEDLEEQGHLRRNYPIDSGNYGDPRRSNPKDRNNFGDPRHPDSHNHDVPRYKYSKDEENYLTDPRDDEDHNCKDNYGDPRHGHQHAEDRLGHHKPNDNDIFIDRGQRGHYGTGYLKHEDKFFDPRCIYPNESYNQDAPQHCHPNVKGHCQIRQHHHHHNNPHCHHHGPHPQNLEYGSHDRGHGHPNGPIFIEKLQGNYGQENYEREAQNNPLRAHQVHPGNNRSEGPRHHQQYQDDPFNYGPNDPHTHEPLGSRVRENFIEDRGEGHTKHDCGHSACICPTRHNNQLNNPTGGHTGQDYGTKNFISQAPSYPGGPNRTNNYGHSGQSYEGGGPTGIKNYGNTAGTFTTEAHGTILQGGPLGPYDKNHVGNDLEIPRKGRISDPIKGSDPRGSHGRERMDHKEVHEHDKTTEPHGPIRQGGPSNKKHMDVGGNIWMDNDVEIIHVHKGGMSDPIKRSDPRGSKGRDRMDHKELHEHDPIKRNNMDTDPTKNGQAGVQSQERPSDSTKKGSVGPKPQDGHFGAKVEDRTSIPKKNEPTGLESEDRPSDPTKKHIMGHKTRDRVSDSNKNQPLGSIPQDRLSSHTKNPPVVPKPQDKLSNPTKNQPVVPKPLEKSTEPLGPKLEHYRASHPKKEPMGPKPQERISQPAKKDIPTLNTEGRPRDQKEPFGTKLQHDKRSHPTKNERVGPKAQARQSDPLKKEKVGPKSRDTSFDRKRKEGPYLNSMLKEAIKNNPHPSKHSEKLSPTPAVPSQLENNNKKSRVQTTMTSKGNRETKPSPPPPNIHSTPRGPNSRDPPTKKGGGGPNRKSHPSKGLLKAPKNLKPVKGTKTDPSAQRNKKVKKTKGPAAVVVPMKYIPDLGSRQPIPGLYTFPLPGEPGGVFQPAEFYKVPSNPGFGVLKALKLDDPFDSQPGRLVPKSSKFPVTLFYPSGSIKWKETSPQVQVKDSNLQNEGKEFSNKSKVLANDPEDQVLKITVVKGASVTNGKDDEGKNGGYSIQIPEKELKTITKSSVTRGLERGVKDQGPAPPNDKSTHGLVHREIIGNGGRENKGQGGHVDEPLSDREKYFKGPRNARHHSFSPNPNNILNELLDKTIHPGLQTDLQRNGSRSRANDLPKVMTDYPLSNKARLMNHPSNPLVKGQEMNSSASDKKVFKFNRPG